MEKLRSKKMDVNFQNQNGQPPVYSQPPVYPPQNGYGPNQPNFAAGEAPLSVGQWMLTLFLLAIPIVRFIMLLVWAFGDGNRSRKNFCRATLLWALIAIGVTLIFYLLCGSLLGGILRNLIATY